MLTSRIVKSCPKFHWTSSIWFVVSSISFAKYQINYIIRPNLSFSSLISYARFVTNDVKFLVHRTCLQISHLGTLQGLHQPSILIRDIFLEDVLAPQHSILGTSLNTLWSSLSGVKRRWSLSFLTEPKKGST